MSSRRLQNWARKKRIAGRRWLSSSSFPFFLSFFSGDQLFSLMYRIKISNGQIRNPLFRNIMHQSVAFRLPFSGRNVSLALTAPGGGTETGVGFGIMNEIPLGGSTLGCLTLRTHTHVVLLAQKRTTLYSKQ